MITQIIRRYGIYINEVPDEQLISWVRQNVKPYSCKKDLFPEEWEDERVLADARARGFSFQVSTHNDEE